MKNSLILILFFIVVGVGFASITYSISKVFVNTVNATTDDYFPEGNNGIGE